MLKLLGSDSCPVVVSTSGMGSDSTSGSTSGEEEEDDWREMTDEARFRARCWASERC